MTYHRQESAEGIAQLEGYLLYHAEISNARAEAEAFAHRLPWLTEGQRTEVVRIYTDERIALSRRVLRGITHRCGELQGEYTARYAELRRRLLCATIALSLGLLSLVTCVLLLMGVP